MPATYIGWTPPTIQQLRSLWAEGHSTAEIGRRMGVSKNAIVGKAHRLHLPARPSPIRGRRDGQAGPPRASRRPPCPPLPELRSLSDRLSPPQLVVAPTAPPRPSTRPRLDLRTIGTNPCCWPLGEPGSTSFRFCGDPATANKPYCPDHAGIAYAKTKRKRSPVDPGPNQRAGRLPGRLCVDLDQ